MVTPLQTPSTPATSKCPSSKKAPGSIGETETESGTCNEHSDKATGADKEEEEEEDIIVKKTEDPKMKFKSDLSMT